MITLISLQGDFALLPSTNSGTPSVLATMCCTTSAGSDFPPARCVIRTSTWGRSETGEGEWRQVRARRPGGTKVGRNVNTCSIEAVGAWSTNSPRSSNVVGSPSAGRPTLPAPAALGLRRQPGHQGVQRLLLLLLGREGREGVALRTRHRQQRSQQGHRLWQGESGGTERLLQLVQPWPRRAPPAASVGPVGGAR